MKTEEEQLTKLALVANTAIQDIQVLTEKPENLSKDEVNSMISAARSAVKTFKDKIEELERNAKMADKETEKLAMEALARTQRSELTRLNGTLRRINLLSLSMLEKQEKEALMGGGETSNLRKRVKDKESAAKASGSITDSLMKTSQMMAEHLQRSNETIETLANSSKGITSTNEELKSMQGHIKTARSLLTKYARKENTHKLFIFLAVVFFLATVLYILKKRLWSAGDTYNIPQQHNNEPVTV